MDVSTDLSTDVFTDISMDVSMDVCVCVYVCMIGQIFVQKLTVIKMQIVLILSL